MIAAAFPGQGAKGVDRAVAFALELPEGRDVVAEATLGRIEPRDFVSGRASAALDRTEVLQPVLVAIGRVVWRALEARGVSASLVLGHSLGELTAWSIAGRLTLSETLAIARLRGELMAKQAALHPGGMLALSDATDVERALDRGRAKGELVIASRNTPREIVLSGDDAAIAAARRAAPSAKVLSVSGAWHSPRMAPAVEPLAIAMRAARCLADERPQIILNRDATIGIAARSIDAVAAQLTAPVEWVRSVERAAIEARAILAIAPSAVLRAHIVNTLDHMRSKPTTRVWAIDDARSLEVAADFIRSMPTETTQEERA